MITRRNFLLRVGATGLLTLMPPALTIPQLEKKLIVGSKGPELFCGLMKGVSDGEITRSSMPEPYALSVTNFTLTATSAHYPSGIPTLAEFHMEAWFRSERENIFSYIGEPVHIQAQDKDVFYSGNFFITEVRPVVDLGEFNALA